VSGVKKVTVAVYEGYVCVYVEDNGVRRFVIGMYSRILYEAGRIEVDFAGGGWTMVEQGDVQVWLVRSYDELIDKCTGVERLARRGLVGG